MSGVAAAAIKLGAPADVAAAIDQAVERYGIQHPAEFIGQMVVESARFTAVVENLNYSADRLAAVWPARYAATPRTKPPTPNDKAKRLHRNPVAIANDVYGSRMGNTAPDDGWRYRGRGYKQLTGKDNYRAYSQDTYGDDRVVKDPDMLLRLPDSVFSGGWYWKRNGIDRYCPDVLKVSKAVNLGDVASKATPNGYNERVSATKRASEELAK